MIEKIGEPNLIEGGMAVDDRGNLKFCNGFDFTRRQVRRFYQVENLSTGIIRAFHGHMKEEKFVYVPVGTIKIIIAPLDKGEEVFIDVYNGRKTFILSSKKPSILHIPAGYAHGFKCLEKGTIIQFFSTSTLEESKNDDYRFKWDILGAEIWETKNR